MSPRFPSRGARRWSRRGELEQADRFYEDLMGPFGAAAAAGSGEQLDGSHDAAELFYADLVGRPSLVRPFPGESLPAAPTPTRRRLVSREVVRWVQQSLVRAGGAPLVADGILGPATAGELRRFQQARGLPADARLLSTTLHRLAAASASVPPGVWLGQPPSDRERVPDLSSLCPDPPTLLDAFAFASATPTEAHRRTLARLAQEIAASQTSPDPVHLVCLDGHTDEVGDLAGNERLGQRRAEAIQDELAAALDRTSPGLSRRLGLWSTSAGETRPIAPNTSDGGRARNRRVELRLHRRWRSSQNDDAGVTVARLGPTPQAEALALAEQATQSFTVPLGQTLGLVATGRPQPAGNPAYTWTSADPTIAAVVQQGTSQSHPNQVQIRGARPGTTTVTVTYRAQQGSVSTSSVGVQTTGPAPSVIAITRPAAHSVWVLLHEPEQASFLTQGISQGGALWTSTTGSGDLTMAHGDPANGTGDRTGAAGTKVRTDERGLLVQGTVASAATGVQVEVLDAAGTAIPLKTSPTATTTSTQLVATVTAPATGSTSSTFEAVVFLDAPSTHLGPLQVRATAAGVSPSASATTSVLLVGVQIALVDDRASNVDGSTRGPVRTEADERFVVDFEQSPQSTRALISAQTRARRMIVYEIAHRSRALSATITTAVTQPEMPLWMAELQLVGIDAAALASFLSSRVAAGGSRELRVSAAWSLKTAWDGPNSGSTTRPYSYTKEWTATTVARVGLDAAGTGIDGLASTGEVASAITPAPTVPPFPVGGRRAAQVVASGTTRRWGRRGGAGPLPAVIVEHQPLLVDAANREIMRGGDGELSLTSLELDGTAVDPGRIATTMGSSSPPAGTPLAMLPTFRVKGVNLPEADRRALVDALVDEFVSAHATDAWVAMLTLAVWQETTWRVLDHESIDGSHFENRGTGRRRFDGQYFGHEQDMPMFGAPAGYGWGQLDNPAVSDDAAWSFAENARAAIALLIGEKAHSAHTFLSAHLSSPPTRRDRAVLQRETVRRYNGGREFEWNGSDWVISPSLAQRGSDGNPNPRLPYPNTVLGTSVSYWTGTGATATFSWPITFTTADFGPGI